MAICSALLKYGSSNFSLEILEYCPVSKLLQIEDNYFKLLKPEYNIAKVAGAPMLGRYHSEDSKAKIRTSLIGKNLGKNNHMFGKTGEKHHNSLKIEVTDLE